MKQDNKESSITKIVPMYHFQLEGVDGWKEDIIDEAELNKRLDELGLSEDENEFQYYALMSGAPLALPDGFTLRVKEGQSQKSVLQSSASGNPVPCLPKHNKRFYVVSYALLFLVSLVFFIFSVQALNSVTETKDFLIAGGFVFLTAMFTSISLVRCFKFFNEQ